MVPRGSELAVSSVSLDDDSVHALITAEERRKRHIAQMLHGPVQTRLLLASLHIEQGLQLLLTDPHKATLLLQQVRRDIDELRERDVRNVSRLLHPAALAAGLVAALRALARSFRQHFFVTIDVNDGFRTLQDSGRSSETTDDWQLACYRIVEECLNNVYFHASARHVQIVLFGQAETGHVHLCIEDDGQGFDPRDVSPGIGMQTVAARCANLGGTMAVRSEPGNGTKVEVKWYVPR